MSARPPQEAPEDAHAPPPRDLDEEEERRKARLVFYGVGGAALLAALTYAGVEFGPPGVVLVLTGFALVLVIAAFWSSIRTLIGETRLSGADAFAIGAPRAEEEQKRAVLRALKDLEFERSVGKISEDDYVLLSNRYRDEAKRLLRQIDLASAEQRDHALAIVNQRLAHVGLGPQPALDPATPAFEPMPAEPPPKPDAPPEADAPEPGAAPAPAPMRPAFEPIEAEPEKKSDA
jgi:hypothetical protein